jgi:hypothetical protein
MAYTAARSHHNQYRLSTCKYLVLLSRMGIDCFIGVVFWWTESGSLEVPLLSYVTSTFWLGCCLGRFLSDHSMFNSPRPGQRYVGSPNMPGFGGSFVDENPLTSSGYEDGLDPWSAAPSPTPTPNPHGPSSVFSSVIGMSNACQSNL